MKNWIIALAILILPLVTYFVLDKTNGDKSNFEAVAASGKPAVIKFASAMCLDCKKMESMMCEVMPLYADKVAFEYKKTPDAKEHIKITYGQFVKDIKK